MQLTVTEATARYNRLRALRLVQFGLEPFAVAVGPRFVSKVHMWRNLEDAQAGAGGSPSNSRMRADSRA
jgi:hypothetical protein